MVPVAADDEEPCAYVVPRNQKLVTADNVAQWVASRVAKVKRLTGGVIFVDSIPKNPVSHKTRCRRTSTLQRADQLSIQSGKILRRELRDRAAKEKVTGALKQARL